MDISFHRVIHIRQLIIWNVQLLSVKDDEEKAIDPTVMFSFFFFSEADSSMFIELTPIEIHLQETLKCRSDYLEIFGYDSSSEETHSGRNRNPIWKSYHTWCGNEPSSNHPLPHARYLITSNSVYISLQTGVSKKTRFFKIRYKSKRKRKWEWKVFVTEISHFSNLVVPSHVRAQYNSEGIAYNTLEQGPGPRLSASVSSTSLFAKTTNFPSLTNRTDFRNVNGTRTKSIFRKGNKNNSLIKMKFYPELIEILITIICGVIVLLLAIAIAILIFILIRRYMTLCYHHVF